MTLNTTTKGSSPLRRGRRAFASVEPLVTVTLLVGLGVVAALYLWLLQFVLRTTWPAVVKIAVIALWLIGTLAKPADVARRGSRKGSSPQS